MSDWLKPLTCTSQDKACEWSCCCYDTTSAPSAFRIAKKTANMSHRRRQPQLGSSHCCSCCLDHNGSARCYCFQKIHAAKEDSVKVPDRWRNWQNKYCAVSTNKKKTDTVSPFHPQLFRCRGMTPKGESPCPHVPMPPLSPCPAQSQTLKGVKGWLGPMTPHPKGVEERPHAPMSQP